MLDFLGVAEADRQDCIELLAGEASAGAAVVQEYLHSRLGSDDDSIPSLENNGAPVSEHQWVEALLRFTPELLQWYAARHIPQTIIADTLADFGRNLSINRRVHGRFGMDTHKWLRHLFAGRIFQLGRLQYLIHQPAVQIPGVAPDEWIVGVHIPEGGGLGPAAVAQSLGNAREFFATYFPEHPVKTANCESWLLDPYLSEHLDASANIAHFAALFTRYGTLRDEPTDAVYFTFRSRSMDHLDELPRSTALQRVVLERIDAGGAWQLGFGYLPLRH